MYVTWSFFAAYCDEVYAPLSTDWAPGGKLAPPGFNLSQLDADLSEVTQNWSVLLCRDSFFVETIRGEPTCGFLESILDLTWM
jgi:hypothetical protein